MTLDYNVDIIDYQGFEVNVTGLVVNDLGGTIKAGWYGNAVTLPTGTVLLTILFKLKPTTETETTFECDVSGGMCEYAGYGGTPIYPATFNDLTWTLPN